MKNILTTILLLSALIVGAQNPIKVNQVGYYPNQEKVAVLEQETSATKARLVDDKGKTVWKGNIVNKAISPWSGKVRSIVDFSSVSKPGCYTLKAGGFEQPVRIHDAAFAQVAKMAMKAFYLQRAGMPIEECYAGEYARPAAHPDTLVLVHPSAASIHRPEGTIIASPFGWYDAGDYNKYIVNSAYSVGVMLIDYELHKEYYEQLSLNIPESSNAVPDYLDEIMYNLKWMITMQDLDGGVYHKLTTPKFEGFVMPKDCQQQRFVVQKSTSATLDFAASMALAARIYKKYPEYKDFAEEALKKAECAYAWAVRNPHQMYDQPGFNLTCKPEIHTGMYPDSSTIDEFFWAATELYFSTGEKAYKYQLQQFMPEHFTTPVWGDIEGLGIIEFAVQSLVSNDEFAQQMMRIYTDKMLAVCDERINEVPTSCFHAPYGNRKTDFFWGCNSEGFASMGIAMLLAYRLSGEEKYLTAAIQTADCILGRNATGYCYVTGLGNHPAMHPHQRLSSADNIANPLPGFLVGGPNPGQQDANEGAVYLSNFPDESYSDTEPSYASNEIAINWNATLVVLMAGIDAEVQ